MFRPLAVGFGRTGIEVAFVAEVVSVGFTLFVVVMSVFLDLTGGESLTRESKFVSCGCWSVAWVKCPVVGSGGTKGSRVGNGMESSLVVIVVIWGFACPEMGCACLCAGVTVDIRGGRFCSPNSGEVVSVVGMESLSIRYWSGDAG